MAGRLTLATARADLKKLQLLKSMKKIAICLFAGLALCWAVPAEAQWLTSLPAAQAKAKAEKKMVLLDFTGSDWCGWCIKLKQEVFSQPAFADYAKKNLVLVEVDFPKRKAQTATQKTANRQLAQQYGITGYPTIIVLDSAGRQLGKLGYMRGGPAAFNAAVDKLRPK